MRFLEIIGAFVVAIILYRGIVWSLLRADKSNKAAKKEGKRNA